MMVWAGRVISALVVLFLLVDAYTGLFAAQTLKAEMDATGFPPNLVPAIGIIALICGVLYAIPATSVIGAVLTTAFLGGAICTHFRVGEILSPPQIVCLVVGVAAWAGLYFRDSRVRQLMPSRSEGTRFLARANALSPAHRRPAQFLYSKKSKDSGNRAGE